MSGLRLLGRQLSRQAQKACVVEGPQYPLSHILQFTRGFASEEKEPGVTSGASPGKSSGAKPQRNWRALADEQLRQPSAEQASAGPHVEPQDSQVQEDQASSLEAASTSAPAMEAAHGAGHRGHRAGTSIDDSLREKSYTEDPFMRSERESRGLGDPSKPPSKPSDSRPKAGGHTKVPKKTIGGRPREIEYDDPFMRSERASRLPPPNANAPKIEDGASTAEPQRDPRRVIPQVDGSQHEEVRQTAAAAHPQQAGSQAGLAQQYMETASQGASQEAELSGDGAAELRNQVRRFESGQPSAAPGKVPFDADISWLQNQADRATPRASAQQRARDEASDLQEGIASISAQGHAAGAARPGPGHHHQGSAMDQGEGEPAAAAARLAAEEEEARQDAEALARTAELAAQGSNPGSKGRSPRPGKTQRRAIAETPLGSVGPDPIKGYGGLGLIPGGPDPANARPLGPGGYPLPLASLSPEQKLAMMRASPRINPNRMFTPGSFYNPQDLVGGDASQMSMFEPQRSMGQMMDTARAPSSSAAALKGADFRNAPLLDTCLTESGRILPRRKTQLSAKDQRALVRKLKLARQLALLPTTSNLASFMASRPGADVA